MFLQGPNNRLTRIAMGLSRKHLRIITGLLTDHVVLNRHLTVMQIHTDPLCPKCGEEEETVYHLLCRCNAMMMACYSIFGSYLMDITELQQSASSITYSFEVCKSLEEIYITFCLSRGCTLGRN